MYSAIHSAAVVCSILWKMTMDSTTILFPYFGLPVLVCLSELIAIMKWAGLMKIFLPIWKRLIFVGDSPGRGTPFFIKIKVRYTMSEAEHCLHPTPERLTSIFVMA